MRWSVDGVGAGADEPKGERAGLVATANERDTVELDASASAGEDDTRGNWTDLFDKQFRWECFFIGFGDHFRILHRIFMTESVLIARCPNILFTIGGF